MVRRCRMEVWKYFELHFLEIPFPFCLLLSPRKMALLQHLVANSTIIPPLTPLLAIAPVQLRIIRAPACWAIHFHGDHAFACRGRALQEAVAVAWVSKKASGIISCIGRGGRAFEAISRGSARYLREERMEDKRFG